MIKHGFDLCVYSPSRLGNCLDRDEVSACSICIFEDKTLCKNLCKFREAKYLEVEAYRRNKNE